MPRITQNPWHSTKGMRTLRVIAGRYFAFWSNERAVISATHKSDCAALSAQFECRPDGEIDDSHVATSEGGDTQPFSPHTNFGSTTRPP
jgi:hypothetical protein